MGVNIRIQPSGRFLSVEPGQTLLEVLNKAGIEIAASCGGKGTCGKCLVKAIGSLSEPDQDEVRTLSLARLASGFRLACQATVTGDVTVWVPETRKGRILETCAIPKVRLDPGVYKVFTRVPPPSSSAEDDFTRLQSTLMPSRNQSTGRARLTRNRRRGKRGNTKATSFRPLAGFMCDLPSLIRTRDGSVTAVLFDDEVIDVEPGDTTSRLYGVAIDIGTTTMVGYLWDLSAPASRATAPVAVCSCYNPQAVRGDDVITRISYASESPDNLKDLQKLVRDGINTIIIELAAKAHISAQEIYSIVLVGNTVMHHLLLGINPKHLGLAPYAPAFTSGVIARASELGIASHRSAVVKILPNIGGFIGSDILAGLLAAGIPKRKGVHLFLDLGTNGEIVMCKGPTAVACSTAAGPAFEGARISMGMRATEGAVSHVFLSGNTIEYETIGDSRPCGICGSGLVDAISVMRSLGVITASGRLVAADELPFEHRHRILDDGSERSFVLVPASESANGEPVKVTQKDVREVQLAKAAIAAGIKVLMKRLGVSQADIDAIFLAGAFGNYIDPISAQNIGLIPSIDPRRIKPLGNSAGTGAQMALLSRSTAARSTQIAREVEAIDLAADPEFSQAFVSSMAFRCDHST